MDFDEEEDSDEEEVEVSHPVRQLSIRSLNCAVNMISSFPKEDMQYLEKLSMELMEKLKKMDGGNE